MAETSIAFDTVPVGPLGIIALPGCMELAKKIDSYLLSWRNERNIEEDMKPLFRDYHKNS